MLPEKKGIYPNWVSDRDVINQVLNEIIMEGGKLPLSYVVNPNHDSATQERMEKLLERMQKGKLIHPIRRKPFGIGEDDFIEIDIEGSRAAYLGYRRYKRIKVWDAVQHKLNRISLIFFAILILALIGLIIYLILHYFKVV